LGAGVPGCPSNSGTTTGDGPVGRAQIVGLVKHPTMRGILFDLPPVVESASSFLRNQGVVDRVEIKGGNFFEAVPAGADAYLLQNILHWRSDEDCVRILKAVHANARSGAKLLLVEAIVEASNEPQFAKTLDIAMLVLSDGGKERTRAEWQDLLSACGLRLSRIVPTASFASVIEAIRESSKPSDNRQPNRMAVQTVIAATGTRNDRPGRS
jgi:O-methyltransferase domain